MEFLRTELATALVFATIAERHCKSGRRKAAHGALASAERGFEELVRFLYGPNLGGHPNPAIRGHLKTGQRIS